jgi:hypothetical protein
MSTEGDMPRRTSPPLDAELIAAAQRIADEAPELTAEQLDQLAVLFRPASASTAPDRAA